MRVHILGGFLALLVAGTAASDAPAASDGRSYASGSYVVYIAGAPGAWVSRIAGGGASSYVVLEKPGSPGSYPKKHAGSVQYEDITLSIGGPMEKGMQDWVKQAIGAAATQRKDGYFVSLDASYKEHSRTTWKDGTISDVTFPALDANNKDSVFISVSIAPSFTQFSLASAGQANKDGGANRAKAKGLNGHAFRLSLSGLDSVSQYVSRVEPLSVRYKIVTDPIGDQRQYQKTPGAVDVSNLVFSVPEHRAAALYQWHDDFVVKGHNGDANEKTATLELLTPDMKMVIYKLTLRGVGILKLTPDAASNESVRLLRAEAYVESVSLD